MSTTRLAIRGVVFNWLGRICALAIAFIVTPILIHALGNEAYGVWAIVMSFATYYAVADLGLRGAAVKYMSQFDAVDDRESANRVVVTTLCMFACLALVVILLAGGVAIIFPMSFDAPGMSVSTLRWVVMICGLGVAVAILGQAFDATLAAAKRFDCKNAIAITAQTLQAILIVVALRLGGSLIEMAFITLGVTIAAQLLTMTFALRSAPYLTLSPRFFDRATAVMLFRFGALFVVQGLGIKASRSSGAIIVGAILGPAVVTFYAIAESLANKSSQLARGVGSVLMPVASQLEAQERKAELSRALLLATRALVAISVSLATIFIVFGWRLVEYWIGESYPPTTYPVLFVLSFVVVMQMSSMASRSVLRGTGKMRFLALVGFLELAVTVSLGTILTKSIGLVGMAIAVAIAQAATAATLLPYYACRSIQLSFKEFLFSGVTLGLLVAVPGGLAALGLQQVASPTNIGMVVLYGAIVGLTTCATLFFFGLGRETRTDVLKSLIPKRFWGYLPSMFQIPRQRAASENSSLKIDVGGEVNLASQHDVPS